MSGKFRKTIGIGLAFGSLLTFGFAVDGAWPGNVPIAARALRNPYAGSPDAAAAGKRLYSRHCASCHGDAAQGIGMRPSLITPRVHDATDGELAWLLENGNLRKGMPSWSRLPDERRWQIVSYLRSLNNVASPDRNAADAGPASEQ